MTAAITARVEPEAQAEADVAVAELKSRHGRGVAISNCATIY